MANPEQTRNSGGMFARKEQTPALKDGKSTGLQTVELGNPDFVYRHFEKPSDTDTGKGRDARLSRLRDFGYTHTALETESYLILACPRDVREKREKAAQDKSAAFLKRPNEGGDTISIEKSRGPVFDE